MSVAPLRKRNLDLDNIGPTVRTYLASHANGRHIARNLHADATIFLWPVQVNPALSRSKLRVAT